MPKGKKIEEKTVEFNNVRKMLRDKIVERYGSVSKFLHSEKGEEFGGMKMKVFLYDTGSVNFNYISKLCKFFGIGELSRKVVVVRTYSYVLNEIK